MSGGWVRAGSCMQNRGRECSWVRGWVGGADSNAMDVIFRPPKAEGIAAHLVWLFEAEMVCA